jgi:hypothetical protein
MPTSKKIYQIKVTLNDIHPPVWRCILVTQDTTLSEFHNILQVVMGWGNYHLHQFTINDVSFIDPRIDEDASSEFKDEANYSLDQVIPQEGVQFTYEYDFGDGWNHTLIIEKILSSEGGIFYPHCLEGKRACPPEDVGGAWGYEEFVKAIRDPFHDQHEHFLSWIGGEFDPEAFDLEDINTQLREM